MAKKYRKTGLQVIRVVSGDNELSALDFQKHYNTPVVHLMDSVRAFERKHNNNGWPFLMFVNPQGKIVYKCNGMIDRDKKLKGLIKKIKETPATQKTSIVDGIPYMIPTLQRSKELVKANKNERFTSIACGKNGNVYTVFTSVEDSNSDIIMKVYRDTGFIRKIPIAATKADEYDATVLVDSNDLVWICWTSNSVGNKYQIYLTNLKNLEAGQKPINVSDSAEDAMHGRMAYDSAGNIWITYYKWQNMGKFSRDKEIYLRKYSKGEISEEAQISPKDVPEYEDHTDPSISVLNQKVLISWSWDYHKPKGYTKKAEFPTIFARFVITNFKKENVFNISGRRIDSTPVLSEASGNDLWCAWDSMGINRKEGSCRKGLYIRRLDSSGIVKKEFVLADNLINLCSPDFAFYKNLKGSLIWSQTKNGKDWLLYAADYDAEHKNFSAPALVISEGNPRFGSCAYDNQGRLWISCSIQTEKAREVVVKQMDHHKNNIKKTP